MENFGRQPNHGIEYDAALYSLSPEELLKRSQINVTPDRTEGLHYAAAALDATTESLVNYTVDYGKAAALFAFRTTLSDGNAHKAGLWFTRSINHLQQVDKVHGGMRGLRESIATNILEGRSFDYMSLKPLQDRKYSHDDSIRSLQDMLSRAHRAYVSAEHKINQLQLPEDACDPYAAMVPKFHAVHESLHGDTPQAISIALTGIRRALHVIQEDDGFKGRIKHDRFVAKQFLITNRVLAFCMAEPTNHVPVLHERRLDFARVIFSGSRDYSMRRAKSTTR